ncbi:MAG: EAL domain-containing protein [Rhodospirillales bacterium]|nr:EAL domain-containing protein [Rhodospirillales bacterium]
MNIVKRVTFAADFAAFFQPIVNARTGRIHHYEALARFPGDGGVLTPHDHIGMAERSGFITVFDLAMVRKIIAWLASRESGPGAPRVAVNISGQTLCSPPCLAELEGLLGDNPWLRGRLMFEITESAHPGNLIAVNAFLQRLRRRGLLVCLDDFGAGAANFEYLSCLEVDIVKLDGTWLQAARAGGGGEAFLRALVSLCQDLGIGTVAEMVEDEAALAFARACGVTYVQGFLFGAPAEDIAVFRRSIPARLFSPQPSVAAPPRRRLGSQRRARPA